MFLKQLKKWNPELIEFALELHKSGQILPDTYVIDLDMVRKNTMAMVAEAKKNNVELLYMTKQIGRNPVVAKEIVSAGIENAVVVDYREAEIFMKNNLKLGNVGHLVQPPKSLLKKILIYGTKYFTMFSIENTVRLNSAAESVGKKQKVILKIQDEKDDIYPGQVGGFTLKKLDEQLDDLKKLSNIEIVGITTFPAILFQQESCNYEPTTNVKTIEDSKKIFEKHGLKCEVVSLPSATAMDSIKLIKELGGTEGEPGHSLTGTTPMHAIKDLPEKPAYCYVSEISHSYNHHSYVYGGGYYRRGHLKHALVNEKNDMKEAEVLPLDNSSIDYYLELDQEFKAGSPVIMASRTQIFVTRSTVALVKGLHNGNPKLIGLYDSQGKKLEEGVK
ncbi:YhfX family PLP-dependent enzyme [Pediococcus acidilactici]|uniref:YhfX family PLP-dependent enzyme n=1 Tax=Pediococcus acidilactici TaxID=1254 RepID=UPI001323B422|nr:YhfX family PLP-dependent enzyme [Pediococcus acidilactici]KAF0370160.1 YhfX family PLP-dependent enzyme [Pediococcus acidilactici]KAF0381933.1 YhfX family PLP-dependent enzyme [Pediococcus acidilactici]KAF0455137.1 YhfX family PLP-dependent enzyme [Pediococcus acidilactici]KAF0477292.1 YhfX family PLP-dependent enzyme [Pediococcus acidilactici]KAF0538118.1 YhfX family PLP-dependent enzyme [Pediococcus acidilactici]